MPDQQQRLQDYPNGECIVPGCSLPRNHRGACTEDDLQARIRAEFIDTVARTTAMSRDEAERLADIAAEFGRRAADAASLRPEGELQTTPTSTRADA